MFWKLIWYLRVEREIAISTFQVVDKSLSGSLCSILTQCLIWFPHKLRKASMIIICCTKTPLSLSPYLCYCWKNFFQCCRHLSFSDRSLISKNQHFQFLSLLFLRNIWFDLCCHDLCCHDMCLGYPRHLSSVYVWKRNPL